MLRLWLHLRRLRQQATPRSNERGAMEAYLREKGAFSTTAISLFPFVRNGAIAAALVLVITVSIGSYAYASDAVLPDSPLYPVRQALEEVQVTLAVTPVQKQTIQRKLVERRQKEVQKLKELEKPIPVKLKKYLQTPPAIQRQILKKPQQRVKREEQRKQPTLDERNVKAAPIQKDSQEKPRSAKERGRTERKRIQPSNAR